MVIKIFDEKLFDDFIKKLRLLYLLPTVNSKHFLLNIFVSCI